jgi:KDO2-lipid IV(A) lauroyltransferase
MNLRRSLIFSAFFCLAGLIGCLPRTWAQGLGRALGRLGFRVLKTRAQVALDNLQLIYGDQLTQVERISLVRGNFSHLGSAILEIIHHVTWTARRTKAFISLEGEANLTQALERGQGAILFSGHLGNFILMGTVLRHVRDLKWLFRDPGDPDLSAVYGWVRGRLGISIIPDNPRERSAFLCGMHLKRKKVLGIFIDQVENGGVYVNFMGQQAGSTIGAARLAQMSGAPLLPIHTVRLPDGRLQVIIEPEFAIRSSGDPERDLPLIVEDMNAVVEKWVRAQPEQWLWGHRRWRKWRK